MCFAVLPVRVLLWSWVATSYSLRLIGAWRSCHDNDLATASPQVRTGTRTAGAGSPGWLVSIVYIASTLLLLVLALPVVCVSSASGE